MYFILRTLSLLHDDDGKEMKSIKGGNSPHRPLLGFAPGRNSGLLGVTAGQGNMHTGKATTQKGVRKVHDGDLAYITHLIVAPFQRLRRKTVIPNHVCGEHGSC